MPLEIKYQYPRNDEFDYEAILERINIDEERENDLRRGKGFIVSEPQNIKKDIKDPNGIFSHRYGQLLQDVNPFADRYKCECGTLKFRIHHGIICHVCHTPVKYVDDDYKYFGYIALKDPYYIIHPNLYKSIDYLISRKKANLLNILEPIESKDRNGFTLENGKASKDEPYKGIGMIEFKERFDEIMNYYAQINPNKIEYYKDIMENKDKVFIQSIPVYTTHLRPFKVDGQYFSFEGTNAIYNLLSKLAYSVNRDHLQMFRKPKSKNKLLYDMQIKYNELYTEMENILAQKKGAIRSLFGGRYNFSSRSVIIPNPRLRIDEVTLPYNGLVELLQQTIINILHKSYNMTYSEAYKMWYKAQIKKNDRIYQIIKGIINDHPRGIPILINRNPTINYGGILQMYVVDISDTFTMDIPVQILKPLAADFDGDCLNILYIINKQFLRQAELRYNPANALYISRNDGMFNNDVNHCRDTLINANTMIYLSRDKYTEEQLERINRLKNGEDQSQLTPLIHKFSESSKKDKLWKDIKIC